MTLVLNEIHLLDGLNKTMLLAAADRGISNPDGSYAATRQKLVPIPYLNGAISYSGLASVFPEGGMQYHSDWLPQFINAYLGVRDSGAFAEGLRNALRRVIPEATLREYPSRFRISGHNSQRLPELWHTSNIRSMDRFEYLDLKGRYNAPSPDFLERDAERNFAWDGHDPWSAGNGVQTYRKGSTGNGSSSSLNSLPISTRSGPRRRSLPVQLMLLCSLEN